MKLQKLFIFAMIFVAVAFASGVQTVSAQKKKTPPAAIDRRWVTFTGYQAVVFERRPFEARYACSQAIYATANFASPVDLSNGFYVTIAADGRLVIQMKMTVDGNPGARRSIPVDIIPDDDAVLGFPEASLAYTRALLTELRAGVHNITVAVSVGEGADEQIAAGTFKFDSRDRNGCANRLERVETLFGDAPPVQEDEEDVEPVVEVDEADTPRIPTRPNVRPQQQQQQQQEQTYVQPARREEQQPEPAKPAEDPEVEINNNCGESRYIKIETPNKGSWNQNFHGQFEYPRLPLGTKIFVVIDGSEQLIDTVAANPSDTSYGKQRIKLCK